MRYNIDHVKLITALRENRIDDASEYLLLVLNEMSEYRQTVHMQNADLARELDHIRQELERLKNGFPLEDPAGHRAYHERVMREQEAHQKMKDAVKKELLQKGMLILLSVSLSFIGINFGMDIFS